jgi:peptide/nickel transport system substrate-binding protein
MLGWTPTSFDAFNALQNVMTLNPEGHGIWNAGRYSNPRVEALTLQIQREIDQDKRNALIKEAFQIHQDDVGHIPLHQQFLAWGVADTVADIKQRPNDDVDLRYVRMRSASDDAAAQTPEDRRTIQD